MAEIKEGILGGVKGKVGTVVGLKYRGKNIIRALPRKSSKPASELQLKQRNKLTTVIRFLKTIRSFVNAHYPIKEIDGDIKVGYDQIRSTLMKHGLAVEENSIGIVAEKVVLAIGPLPPAPINKISLLKKRKVKIQWDNSTCNGLTAADDLLTILMFNEELNVFHIEKNVGIRESKYNSIALPEHWNSGKIHFWSVWTTIDQSMHSTSLYHNAIELEFAEKDLDNTVEQIAAE
ncbi:MAG: DUF6266 family protein [Flavobacteriaceae bacterium]|jgi:hypothetical protein|nr:DUF6266 family protein [Flavobacteriaceae bacterium]